MYDIADELPFHAQSHSIIIFDRMGVVRTIVGIFLHVSVSELARVEPDSATRRTSQGTRLAAGGVLVAIVHGRPDVLEVHVR